MKSDNQKSKLQEIETQTIIIDSGTCSTKIGVSGDDAPRHIIPTVLARPLYEIGEEAKQVFVGSEVHNTIYDRLKYSYPMERGLIRNWDDMYLLWNHIFSNALRTEPKECNVLLTEKTHVSNKVSEYEAELFFEQIGVSGMYVQNQQTLSLYASGKVTGLVVDCGEGTTTVAPIFEGFPLKHTVSTILIGGQDVDKMLQKAILEEASIDIEDMRLIRGIKEKYCFVAPNYESFMTRAIQTNDFKQDYTLPDGHSIGLNSCLFTAPELLFNPGLLNSMETPLQQLVKAAVLQCDGEIRGDLYQNIVLAGGGSMFSGILEKLETEVFELNGRKKVRISAPPDRNVSSFVGGSIISCLPSFDNIWVTRQMYDDYGRGVLGRKCM